MYIYSSVGAEIADTPVTKQMEFALLDMDPLSRALKENARCWVTSLGKLLNDSARESLTGLTTKLEVRICMCMCTCRYIIIELLDIIIYIRIYRAFPMISLESLTH